MRSVHLLGMGLVVGAVALGAMLSVMTYQWQVQAFPEAGPVAVAAAGQAGSAGSNLAAQDSSKGKTLFEGKCAGCHTVGGGKRMGPDLKGVAAQRPHDWLVGFITAPDKVIAGGDPIAAALVKEYGMPMPNLGISKEDAEAILAYLAK